MTEEAASQPRGAASAAEPRALDGAEAAAVSAATDARAASDLVWDAWREFLVHARASVLPRDLAAVVFRCASCRLHRPLTSVITHSPYLGEVGAPAYREARDLGPLLETLSTRRHPLMARETYEAMRACPCGAPPHHVKPVGAALFHAMVGTGAHLMAAFDGGELELARYPVDGVPELVDPDGIAASFGRPLSLFVGWRRLATPGEPVRAVEAEPGVLLLSSDGEPGSLEAAADALARTHVRVVFEVDAGTARRAGWPTDLEDVADAIEAGELRLALSVDRDRLVRQLDTLCAMAVRSALEDAAPDELRLGYSGLYLTLRPSAVVASMGRFGRTLAEACAHTLEVALLEAERARQLVVAAARLRPDRTWQIEEGTLRGVDRDGAGGRGVDALELARRLSPDDPELARELAFIADDLPPWADPTRTCPCGAPAGVQRRLVSAGFVDAFIAEHGGAVPGIVSSGPDPAQPAAAEVVVIGCDRHLRFLAWQELERLGLTGARLRERFSTDRGLARFDVTAGVAGTERSRAMWARGPYAASLIVDDGWAASLSGALSHPFGRGAELTGLALGTGLAVFVRAGLPEDEQAELIAAAAGAAGLPSARAELVVSMPVSLAADPAGEIRLRQVPR